MEITASLVKELRDRSGAGMMDCKKALSENGGDMEKSAEWLRIKGLGQKDKKAGRVAAEGQVASYIHMGGKIGVLCEINCESDFVARGLPRVHPRGLHADRRSGSSLREAR